MRLCEAADLGLNSVATYAAADLRLGWVLPAWARVMAQGSFARH